ncbi:MAG: alpha/beta fold hydrolase, partial [Paracoccaceae bacterium]
FDGIAGVLFPAIAKLLAAVPFSAGVFSTISSSPTRVQALIRSTGSELDTTGLAQYRKLVADRDHVDGTLLMMAQWSLTDLISALPDITAKTCFITGEKDGTVPPRVAHDAAQKMPNATVVNLARYGHLVHEEDPATVAKHILDVLLP